MKRNYILSFFLVLILGVLLYRCIPHSRQYINAYFYRNLPMDTTNIPLKNKQIIRFTIKNGEKISPTYKSAVCTEYIIQVLSGFTQLSTKEKSEIRIITDKKIEDLLKSNSSITKGVYTALITSKKGIAIDKPEEVKAGDFVQFWNNYRGEYVGHCGIVRALDLKKGIISMYSSSPSTDGHGEQVYIIPDYIYFVRLK